jgi:PAS domain S-box-containing protein
MLNDLRKSLAWMDLVMTTLTESVVVIDQNMCILFVNDAFAQFAGKMRVLLLGKPFLKVFSIFKDEHRLDMRDFSLPLVNNETLKLNGIYSAHAKGELRYIEIEAAHITKIEQAVLVIRDITEKRNADDEIFRINKELETFSYSVSHDLRAPLRGINGFSQALLEDYGDTLDETAKGYLHRIRSAATHMGELIEGLLNLSHITRKTIETQSVDLSAVARDITELLQKTEPTRDVKFNITEGLYVSADPTLIRIVMENLLENAWKYTSKTPHTYIEFGTTDDTGSKVYFVRDNGVGFSMAYIDKLFVPFQRLHSSADFSGTGIGLATVQRIIHRHGGEVWASGEVGKGATFSFTIPNQQ